MSQNLARIFIFLLSLLIVMFGSQPGAFGAGEADGNGNSSTQPQQGQKPDATPDQATIKGVQELVNKTCLSVNSSRVIESGPAQVSYSNGAAAVNTGSNSLNTGLNTKTDAYNRCMTATSSFVARTTTDSNNKIVDARSPAELAAVCVQSGNFMNSFNFDGTCDKDAIKDIDSGIVGTASAEGNRTVENEKGEQVLNSSFAKDANMGADKAQKALENVTASQEKCKTSILDLHGNCKSAGDSIARAKADCESKAGSDQNIKTACSNVEAYLRGRIQISYAKGVAKATMGLAAIGAIAIGVKKLVDSFKDASKNLNSNTSMGFVGGTAAVGSMQAASVSSAQSKYNPYSGAAGLGGLSAQSVNAKLPSSGVAPSNPFDKNSGGSNAGAGAASSGGGSGSAGLGGGSGGSGSAVAGNSAATAASGIGGAVETGGGGGGGGGSFGGYRGSGYREPSSTSNSLLNAMKGMFAGQSAPAMKLDPLAGRGESNEIAAANGPSTFDRVRSAYRSHMGEMLP